MEITYTSKFNISSEDFNDMIDRARSGIPISQVIDEWATGLDDSDYYRVNDIEEQLTEEIQKWVLPLN